MNTVIQHPKLQATDPAFRRRIRNSFSVKRGETLQNARHLLACLIRLSDAPAYADVGTLLPACQDIVDALSDLDPAKPETERQLVEIAALLERIAQSVTVCTERQRRAQGRDTPAHRRMAAST